MDSVLRQSFPDFELIVVDDGSTDKSVERIGHFVDSRLKIVQQQNVGVAAARNRGIAESRGRYVSFLDADDQKDESYLKVIFDLIGQFPQAGIYGTAYRRKSVKGNYSICDIRNIPPAPWQGVMPNYFRSATFGDPPLNGSTVTIPRSVLNAAGGFRNGVRMGEDLDLWGRIALKYQVAFSWHVGATYFLDASNRAHDHQCFLPPFVQTIEAKRQKGMIPKHLIRDLDEYCNRLLLNDASRALIISGNQTVSRKILKGISSRDIQLERKKKILLILSYSPQFMVRFLWQIRSYLFVS